MAKNCLTVK